jgi:hypothetical protein
MYTIIVTRKSGTHSVTITDNEDVKDLIVGWHKERSTAKRIEVLHPNHQTKDVYTWDSKGKFWSGLMGLAYE